MLVITSPTRCTFAWEVDALAEGGSQEMRHPVCLAVAVRGQLEFPEEQITPITVSLDARGQHR